MKNTTTKTTQVSETLKTLFPCLKLFPDNVLCKKISTIFKDSEVCYCMEHAYSQYIFYRKTYESKIGLFIPKGYMADFAGEKQMLVHCIMAYECIKQYYSMSGISSDACTIFNSNMHAGTILDKLYELSGEKYDPDPDVRLGKTKLYRCDHCGRSISYKSDNPVFKCTSCGAKYDLPAMEAEKKRIRVEQEAKLNYRAPIIKLKKEFPALNCFKDEDLNLEFCKLINNPSVIRPYYMRNMARGCSSSNEYITKMRDSFKSDRLVDFLAIYECIRNENPKYSITDIKYIGKVKASIVLSKLYQLSGGVYDPEPAKRTDSSTVVKNIKHYVLLAKTIGIDEHSIADMIDEIYSKEE